MNCRKCKKEIPDESKFCLHCGTKQVYERSRRVRANGQGTAYRLKNGKWRAEIDLGKKPDGKRHRKTKEGFATKKDALAYIETLKSGGRGKDINLSYLYNGWENSKHYLGLSESKQVAYKIAFDKLKSLHFIPLKDLRIEELQAVIDSVDGYYPCRDMRQVLSHLFKIAEINGDIVKNYAKFLRLPTLEAEEKEPFNEEEILKIWEDYNAGHVFTGYMLLMIYAGMGPGEVLKTEKSMINWEEQTIVGAGVKTRKGKEFPIIIADDLIPVLRSLCAYSGDSPMLFSQKENAFRERYEEAIRRMGIRPLKPYSCRHTCATALTLAGVEPAIIKAIMRHTRYQTTLGYTHVKVKPLLEAVNKLGKTN